MHNVPVTPSPPADSLSAPVLDQPVRIKYLGASARMVKGVSTKNLYLFSPEEPGLLVDRHDVNEMLKSLLFVRA